MTTTARRRCRSIGGLLLLAGLLLLPGTGAASSASFDPRGATMIGGGFLPDGLGDLPTIAIDGETPLLRAGDPVFANLAVELIGSQTPCILAGNDDAICQRDLANVTGPYKVLMTVEVNVLDTQALPGEFTLLIDGMRPLNGSPPGPYAPSEVTIDLDPGLPAGFDPSGAPGFVLTDFDPFVRVTDVADLPDVYDYIGWTVTDGSTVTFAYDVLVAPVEGRTPAFTAIAVPVVVPEPGTALLMGLGLTGLALGNRRISAGTC